MLYLCVVSVHVYIFILKSIHFYSCYIFFERLFLDLFDSFEFTDGCRLYNHVTIRHKRQGMYFTEANNFCIFLHQPTYKFQIKKAD